MNENDNFALVPRQPPHDGVIIAHNHPSGESTPSEADIKITRDLIRAGQLLKIEVLDHIVIGNPNHTSLRSLGYWAGS